MNPSAAHAYECALMMTEKVAQTIWSVFTGLVATHAFLVALSTYALTQEQIAPYATKIMAILGLFVCLAWFLITQRSFSFYGYYFACARKYEGEAFGDDVTMVRQGAKFSSGETAAVGADALRMDWGGRLFKVKWLVLSIIAIFALIYVYIFSLA